MRIQLVGLLGCALAACQGNEGQDPLSRDGQVPAGDQELIRPCLPDCAAPQVCSKAGVCIEPGTCAHELDCAPGETCDPVKKTCVPTDQCGAQELKANVVAPNLLIVLDRSCSMTALAGTKTKFAIAVAALAGLLARNAGRIRFGLTLFPDITGNNCHQDAIPLPLASGNEAKISGLLNAALAKADPYFPDGPCVTNIDSAMQQAATDPALKEKGRESYVLLITDGKQAGCSLDGGDANTTKIITGLRQAGVSTFVVGFGAGVDPSQLNIFADAGGKAKPSSTTRYHKAEDQTSLEAALATISKESFGCVFKLQQPPPDLQKIYVFFDDKEVAQDRSHQSGWDYDAATTQVTFYGAACKSLEESQVADLDIVYGCQKPVPPEKPGDPKCSNGANACQTDQDCAAGYACVSRCCNKVLD